jgi:hypothetical protein
MVDTELGVNGPITSQQKIRSMIYLDIARSKFIGFCVTFLTTIGEESAKVNFSTELYPGKVSKLIESTVL